MVEDAVHGSVGPELEVTAHSFSFYVFTFVGNVKIPTVVLAFLHRSNVVILSDQWLVIIAVQRIDEFRAWLWWLWLWNDVVLSKSCCNDEINYQLHINI